ncbi:membrane bound O-acyltransferase, MBOAT Ale1 [Schizosaccharomyces pombe]|uniref:Lysophospholipid acyltransferase n=1 Tax=Schizosaccharomyces pombe (strain 972 / ATCC 24843) TaxID=284812 RepID=ALE1_SCHPO|nr:putative MBOAT family O-acyltransferase [Schizosaccharomyces pombe]O42916.1 RecName: Full=Lysophospholipid acyltransferase; Short=LPLAT; AltName: Full=1-acyl-sn-glycerol-3-phosphate acyltransferase; Short=AGPAT; AltName: Full=Lysophosphatidic acid acyltransferase; Short=LPAAT; AltName: Full=Lysophosphatidylcholine acyltransferase; Short=LPCAT; AltName: Full=Lysophosphatidylethanolamine acyltransferase; Short=LPEAT [Schizosaccharomyces pombe 972h-]BAF93898.1 lysophospholipid acyltransferase [Sc|eukprot:NP_596779.1 putative MBOAT family O-acyltransferase [Schizosaccharomyces pombe]
MAYLIDIPFEYFSSFLGVHPDQLKLLFCFLSAYPFAGILKRLPSAPWIRNLFSISIGLFYLIGVHHLYDGVLVLLFDALFTYFVAAFYRSSRMPWIIFIVILGHTFSSHVIRYIYPSENTDITASQMVLCMKLTAFAWSVYDGRLPSSELSSYQKDRALRKIPNILYFLGYVFFFPSLLVGPAFDYVDYERFITLSMFKPLADPYEKQITPHSLEPALGRCWRGLLWLILFITGSSIYPLKFLLTPKFASSPILLKYGYVCITAFVARMKYYGAWELSDGACILSGIGYNGLDSSKHPRWDRVKNIDPIKFEFADNIKCALEAWNMNTNKWLRNYVYLRVAKKGKRPGFKSTLSTFTVSAMWHGVSAGYYLTFVSAAFIQTVAKYTRRHVRPFFLKPDMETPGPFKRVYDVIGMVATNLSLSYLIISFLLLNLKESIHVWKELYFIVHIYILIALAVFNSPIRSKLDNKIRSRVNSYKLKSYEQSMKSTSDTDMLNMSVPKREDFENDE